MGSFAYNGSVQIHTSAEEVPGYGHAAVRCLLDKGADYVRVAQAFTILGSGCTPELISGVSGVEIDTAARISRWLTRAQLLSRHGAVRDEVRPHLMQLLPRNLQRSMHARAALLLYRAGSPALAISRHLTQVRGAQFPWAYGVLRQAADDALAADSAQLAAHYLEAAYRLAPDDRSGAAIAGDIALIEWRINPSTTTRNFARLTTAIRAQQISESPGVSVIHYLLWHGRIAEVENAVKSFTSTGDSRVIDNDVRRFHNHFVAYSFPGLAAKISLPPTNTPSGPRQCDSVESATTQAADVIERIRSDSRESEIQWVAHRLLVQQRLNSSTALPLMTAVEGLVYADKFEVAGSWCDTLRAEATARRSPTWQAMFAGLRAEIWLRLGDVKQASEEAKLALSYLRPGASGVVGFGPVATLVRALVAAGSVGEARAHCERQLPSAIYETRWALQFLHARGQLLLSEGNPTEALRDFQRCGELMQQWDLDIPGLVAWRIDVAQALLALRDTQSARSVALSHIERLGGGTTHSTGGQALRLIAATLEPVNRIPVLRQAVAIARQTHRRLDLATALTDLSLAYEQVGDRDKFRSLRQAACQAAVECGAQALLKRFSHNGSTVGFDNSSWMRPRRKQAELLSPAERRVAQMAAEGSSNREIAQSLGITTSTVEQHLTRTFKKLRITRRTELCFVMVGQAGQTSAEPGRDDCRHLGDSPYLGHYPLDGRQDVAVS